MLELLAFWCLISLNGRLSSGKAVHAPSFRMEVQWPHTGGRKIRRANYG